MSLENILSQEIVQRLGWTLLHFVWQATAVAVVLAILLAGLRKAAPNVRYIISCLALGLMVLLPVVTMQLVPVSVPQPMANIEPPSAPAIAPMQPTEGMPLAGAVEYEEPAQLESTETASMIPWKQRATKKLEASLPYLVSGWLIGVFGLSLWHLGGWAQLQRLRRKLTRPVDASLHAALRPLAGRLGVNRAVELLESALVQVPTVVGWLRPVILLPAVALTGLSTEQLEALLAHELAHIRRHDYLVNMLQTIIETLGFYHPAVWWVSYKIRIERENCSDDLAVSICGDRVRYARALTSMEEIRCGQPEFAVAASGGNLLARIHRLLGKEAPDSSRTSWIPSVITILLMAIIAIPTTLALTGQSEERSKTDIETLLLNGFRENRDKFKCGVLAWTRTTKNDGIPGTPNLLQGSFQLWWSGKKMTTRYVDDQVVRTPEGGPYRVEKWSGGSIYDGSLLSRKPRYKPDENWFNVIHWTGPTAIDQEIPALMKRRNIEMDFSRVAVEGRDLLKLLTRNIDKTTVDYGAYTIRYFDPSKGYGLTNEEWYTEDDRLRLRFTYGLGEVIPTGWFPLEVDVKGFSLIDGKVYWHRCLALDLERCSFNDPSAIPKGIFDFSAAKEHEQLNDIVERLSKGAVADKTDDDVKGPLESVENYITAALEGDDERAAKYASLESAVATQTKDMRELLEDQDIKIVAACIGEWNTLAISSAIQVDHGRVGSVVFHLKKVVLDQEVHRLIDDMDVETLDTIEGQIKRFIERNPQARTVLLKPQRSIITPVSRAGTQIKTQVAEQIREFSKNFFAALRQWDKKKLNILLTDGGGLYSELSGYRRSLDLSLVKPKAIYADNEAGLVVSTPVPHLQNNAQTYEIRIGLQNKDGKWMAWFVERGTAGNRGRINSFLSRYPKAKEIELNIYDEQVGEKTKISELLDILENEKYAHTRSVILPLIEEIGERDPTSFLVEQLLVENRKKRCTAGLVLELLGDKRGVPAIVKELSDASYRTTTRTKSDGTLYQDGQVAEDHYYAALLLGILGDERAVPALIEATRDEKIDYQAAISLGQIGDRSAVPALQDMLKRRHNNSFSRLFAGYGLAMLGNKEGLKVVIDTLNNPQEDWTIRRHAIEALGKLGDKETTHYLIAALKDEHPNIKVSAAKALGAIGDVAALPALEQALRNKTVTEVNTPTSVSESAAEAIYQIRSWGEPAEGAQARLLDAAPIWGRSDWPHPVVRLRLDARNEGGRFLHLPENGLSWQIEVDGLWYEWVDPQRHIAPKDRDQTALSNGGRLLDFNYGDAHSGLSVEIAGDWRQIPDGKEDEFARRRFTGYAVIGDEYGPELVLQPGRHRIRVAITCPPSRAGVYRPVRMVSNPVEFTLSPQPDPPAGDESAEWRKQADSGAGSVQVTPTVTKAGEGQAHVRVELSVVEISSDSRIDRETAAKIKNLLDSKITVPESPTVADLLRRASQATAQVKDESARDKRVTQEQFDTLFDLLVSRGYMKILMNPTLEAVEGQTAQAKTDQSSLEIAVQAVENDAIDLQVQADLSSPVAADGNDQTPMFSRRSLSSRVHINSGQSLIIGGLVKPGLRPEPAGDAKSPQSPAKEIMFIVTASLTTWLANAEPQDQAAATKEKEYEVVRLTYIDANEAVERIDKALGQTSGIEQTNLLIQPLEQTGQIIIFGKPDVRAKAKRLLTEIDVPAEEMKRMRSAKRLSILGRAMLAYANDHDGKYPPTGGLYELRGYLKTEGSAWPRQYEYLAGGRTTRDPPDVVISYDAQLFEQGKGTNVLFNDGQVEFVGPKRLDELNINKTLILIEARILEVTDDFLKENRLDADSVRTRDIRSAAEPNSLTYCLIFDDLDVNLLLKATAAPQGKEAKMLTAPRVLALDGRPVTMKIITEELPVPSVSDPNDPSGKAESKPQYAEIGTSVKITADAPPDTNNVLLDCEWELSQVRDFGQRIGPDGKKKQKVPVIDRYNMRTRATVPEGRTLLIGRKKIRRWVVTGTKTPLLGDLPLIGSLFRSESRVEETRNVLILIKPTIDPEGKAEVRTVSGPEPHPLEPDDPLVSAN